MTLFYLRCLINLLRLIAIPFRGDNSFKICNRFFCAVNNCRFEHFNWVLLLKTSWTIVRLQVLYWIAFGTFNLLCIFRIALVGRFGPFYVWKLLRDSWTASFYIGRHLILDYFINLFYSRNLWRLDCLPLRRFLLFDWCLLWGCSDLLLLCCILYLTKRFSCRNVQNLLSLL